VALEHGASVRRCLELVATLRSTGITQPFLLMGYLNPILAYGSERYVADAAAAGADGCIIPDLPPEEAGAFAQACRARGFALVNLLAPTASLERAAFVASTSSGFLYLVSVTGVTGARRALTPDVASFVARVRELTDLPLAVGFGVSTPAQAAVVGQTADGVIVGSALVNAVDAAGDRPAAAAAFVAGLREALVSSRAQAQPPG
jgi:tryptophan synthase alpha chain